MKFAAKCAALAVIGMASSLSMAAPVTYDFTGVITFDQIDATSDVGQSFTGSFTVNPTLVTRGGNTNAFTYVGANGTSQVFSFNATLPSVIFTTATGTGYDEISGSDNLTTGATWVGQEKGGNNTSELDFGPITTSLLESNGYLTNWQNAISASATEGILFAGAKQLDFKFSQVSEVPLPASFPLLVVGAGLLGLASLRKRSSGL